MKPNYQKTLYACFIGYMVQAIVNNFAPLLFLTFQKEYDISLSKVTLLVTFNFGIQLLIDFISAGFIDKIGYRASVMAAHICTAAGLIGLTVLPDLLPDPFIGLLTAVSIYAVGGGILEVLISPITEACPTDNKEKAMSLLHSFYCWGHVGVVLLSSIFFQLAGIENWKVIAVFWAIVPLLNAVLFYKVPIATFSSEHGTALPPKKLIRLKTFWILMLIMVCAGASEQSVSQWASAFAERGLRVDKTLGDLAGPMFFAIMMGMSRMIYGKFGEKINLNKFMYLSAITCIFSYFMISVSPWPVLSLIGCGLCGLSVGIMWPGTFSIAAASIKRGQTVMFAYLALAGDLGCSGGPTYVGLISGYFHNNLKTGIFAAVIFPVLLILGIMLVKKTKAGEKALA